MSEISKFEALERKITQAIDRVAVLREEKKDLQAQLAEVIARNATLKKEVEGIRVTPAKSKGPDMDRIRVKVDSLLEKIEALEL